MTTPLGGSMDVYDDAARVIHERFDEFFGALGNLIRAVTAAGPEATKDLRSNLLDLFGAAFDEAAQSGRQQ